jgi:hypothetical protein
LATVAGASSRNRGRTRQPGQGESRGREACRDVTQGQLAAQSPDTEKMYPKPAFGSIVPQL